MILVQVSEAEPIGFLKNLDQLREVGSSVSLRGMTTGFRMKDIVKSTQQDFIAYQGSLTTPPCSEAVSWLVARHPMKISRQDVSTSEAFVHPGQTTNLLFNSRWSHLGRFTH